MKRTVILNQSNHTNQKFNTEITQNLVLGIIFLALGLLTAASN